VGGPGRTPAKICGLTRPEDAEAAVRLGASYLGVVFAGGPREVSVAQARSIVAAAGAVPVLGIFGSQSREEMLHISRQAGLRGAQLHGATTGETAEALRQAGLLVVTVAHLAGDDDLPRLDVFARGGGPILVEPRVAGRLGGSGAALPLGLARRARARLAGCPMWLAGGLTPESVAGAVRQVGPAAVDVSSGVEQIPGIKDHDKLARFLEALDCE
jgi:phosphoribosylanthranilate isomerase